MVGKYVDLTELSPFMDIFLPGLLYILPWANYETDFSLPEQMIIQKQGHSCRTQKPHAHLQQTKQRLKLGSSTSQQPLKHQSIGPS